MIVWHVTSRKKLLKYLEGGFIIPPVRAWKNISDAERFSVQTGRQIILRLKFPSDAPELEGHHKGAVWLDRPYEVKL